MHTHLSHENGWQNPGRVHQNCHSCKQQCWIGAGEECIPKPGALSVVPLHPVLCHCCFVNDRRPKKANINREGEKEKHLSNNNNPLPFYSTSHPRISQCSPDINYSCEVGKCYHPHFTKTQRGFLKSFILECLLWGTCSLSLCLCTQ